MRSFGQSESNIPVTYDTTITESAMGEGPVTWNVRITRQKTDRSLRPAIFFMPGQGEVGTDASLLRVYGPHYWLLNGWDGGVKLRNGTHYPVIVSIQQPAQNMRPWHLKAVLETLLNVLPVKRNSVHVTGLSQGSYEWGELIGFAAKSGDETAMSEIKSWVNLEGVSPGDNFLGYDLPFPQAYQNWVKKYGGKFFGLEGTQDSRNIWQLSQAMNSATANSAYFSYENIGGGGHCCWNSMYDPSVINWSNAVTPLVNANVVKSTNPASTMGSYFVDPSTGSNIFQWMLRQGDTAMVGATATPTPPTVSAGTSQTVTMPTNWTTLQGTATAAGSTITSNTWTKTAGPAATIAAPTSLNTNVTSLSSGTYTFTLTSKDNLGQMASSSTTVTVVAAAAIQAPTVTLTSLASVTLPVNSINLAGTPVVYGGTTVKSVAWTMVSGPNTPLIASPAAATTSIRNMVGGTYVFRLTVTDSKGSTGYSQETVKVNGTTAGSGNSGTVTAPTTTAKILVAPGEYQVFFIDETKHLYSVGTNLYTQGVNASGIPGTTLKVAVPSNLTFNYAAAGLHGGAAVDNNGNVWAWGDNDQGQCGNGATSTTQVMTPVQVSKDINGSTFTGVSTLTAYYSGNVSSGWYAIKTDGSLWVWGQTLGGMQGDGTTGSTALTRPKQVPVPGSRKVAQVVAGTHAIVLCTDGTVWTCGGSGENPQNLGYAATSATTLSLVQLTGLSGITQVAGGGSFNYALKSDGTLYGWGYYGNYMGGSSTENSPVPTPIDLKTRLNLPHPVKTIVTDMVCTHAILTDGSLWGWGDNAQGGIGNGKEQNFATTTYPWSWDWLAADLLQLAPIQITSRTDFVGVFATQPFVMYTYAETADGTLYSWGRNKGGVLGNGIVGCSEVAASYPNSWDVPTPTIVTPLSIKTATQVPSPYCILHPATSPCNTCSLVSKIISSDESNDRAVAAQAGNSLTQGANSLTKEEIVVYPTVTNGMLNVRISSDTTGLVQLVVFDMTGRMMQIDRTNKQDVYLNQQLNVGRLPAGMYTLQVLIGNQKRMVTKFVKQ